MTKESMSYTGTKDAIHCNISQINKKTKRWHSRSFYQVNMCFGGNWKVTARLNNDRAKREAMAVAKWLQKHGKEVVAMALNDK